MKSTQKQPNCEKRCGPCKKGSMKKVVQSKVVAQKWLWWSDNGKKFNNISGKFVLPPPTGNRHQNSPEMLLLKFLPLPDHHSHFWATTFDFKAFFMLPFLHGLHLFFTVWLFLCSMVIRQMSKTVSLGINCSDHKTTLCTVSKLIIWA